MQISKTKLNPKIDKQIKDMLIQVAADLKSQHEVKVFLGDFLTPAEFLTLAKRLAIAVFLEKGKSYDEIRKILKVSSATIASVQAMLEQPSAGFKLAIKQLKAEEWAQAWAGKISKFFLGVTSNKES